MKNIWSTNSSCGRVSVLVFGEIVPGSGGRVASAGFKTWRFLIGNAINHEKYHIACGVKK